MRPLRSLALLTTVLVVAGCTSSADHGKGTTSTTSTTSTGSTVPSTSTSIGSATAAPSPSSTVSATSTATPWTQAVAAQRAAAIFTDVQSSVTTLSKVPANASLAQAQHALQALANADQSAITELAAGAWPAAARPKVNAFIAALDSERRTLLVLVSKTSTAAMQGGSTAVAAELAQVSSTGQDLTTSLK